MHAQRLCSERTEMMMATPQLSRTTQIERTYDGWVGVCLQVSLFYPGILMTIFTGARWLTRVCRQPPEMQRNSALRMLKTPHKLPLTFPPTTVLNVFIKHTGSTGAVPATTYLLIVCVWFVVSIPLAFVGGFFARKVRLAFAGPKPCTQVEAGACMQRD